VTHDCLLNGRQPGGQCTEADSGSPNSGGLGTRRARRAREAPLTSCNVLQHLAYGYGGKTPFLVGEERLSRHCPGPTRGQPSAPALPGHCPAGRWGAALCPPIARAGSGHRGQCGDADPYGRSWGLTECEGHPWNSAQRSVLRLAQWGGPQPAVPARGPGGRCRSRPHRRIRRTVVGSCSRRGLCC